MNIATSSPVRSRIGRTVALCALVAVAACLLPRVARTDGPSVAELEGACEEGDPFLVTTTFKGLGTALVQRPYDDNAPSVLLFSDTPSNRPQYSLATIREIGSVWGLAYRGSDHSVYAAAYHKVQLPFGPGGPGAVYRIDLETGGISHALTVPNAGPDYHENRIALDTRAEPWAGRTSLGDIDLSEDESTLYAVNMADRRIYRFALPSGDLVGRFAHGAAGEDWSDVARPFGLAVHQGQVYHGVVRTAADSLDSEELTAHVYRSRWDGGDMIEVLSFALDFERGWDPRLPGISLTWQPWRDGYAPPRRRGNVATYPMPMLSDLSFDGDGNMVLGFRDRLSDSMQHYREGLSRGGTELAVGSGIGDIVQGSLGDDGWTVDVANEHFDDGASQSGDESALGGLAQLRHSDVTVSSANVHAAPSSGEGAYWFDNATGNRVQHEQVGGNRSTPLRAGLSLVGSAHAHCPVLPRYWEIRSPPTLGDVELLCASDVEPTATPTGTPTSVPTAPPTPTVTGHPPTATSTPTTPATEAPTPTATLVPVPVFVPIALKERCDPDHERADVVLVIDTSGSMAGRKIEDAKTAALAFVDVMDLADGRDQVSIVRFDSESEVSLQLTADRVAVVEAIRGLRVRTGTHVDKGLRNALGELRSERREPANTAVAVLLTDGIHNGAPGADLQKAQEVRDAGIRLYTIGLGADVDGSALEAMAGDKHRYYQAPDSGDLAAIYGEIARDIACPADRLWPRR